MKPERTRYIALGALVALFAACGTTEEPAGDDVVEDTSVDSDGGETDSEDDSTDTDDVDPPDVQPDVPPDTEPDTDVGVDGDTGEVCVNNPAGCRSTGCDEGEVCWTDFWSGLSCTPSSCECDPTTGTWSCTEDCGGGECVPEPGAACAADADCPLGAQWCEGGVCEECNNNSVVCDIFCEFGLLERNGCHPCECAPAPTCADEPPTGCNTNDNCDSGEVCVPSDAAVCLPSSCSCDAASGLWACTDDCATGTCEPDAGATDCATDNECTSGERWCEDGECVECDNSGLVCFLGCVDGFELAERNGCHPCECVPISDCASNDDCEAWQRCEAGGTCLTWCAAGDPACCYGNTCVDLPD